MSRATVNENCIERAVVRFGYSIAALPFLLLNAFLLGSELRSWKLGIAIAVGGFLLSLFYRLRKLYLLVIIGSFLFVLRDFITLSIRDFGKTYTWFDGTMAIGSHVFTGFVVLFLYSALLSFPWEYRNPNLAKPKPENFSNKNNSTAEEPPVNNSGKDSIAFDPFEILSVERTASPKQIRTAYLEQIQLYHPDRVGHLGPELQRLAHEQTLNIRRAYDHLVSA